jgi:hypothetical protein
MGSYTTQPVPKNLREQMVQRMQSASEDDLLFAYEIMLMAEKNRVWKQIQSDAAAEAAAGLHENLPELIQQYRMRNRTPA